MDVNDKITNKRGTDVPGQYERRSETETNQLLNGRDPKEIRPNIDLKKEKRVLKGSQWKVKNQLKI